MSSISFPVDFFIAINCVREQHCLNLSCPLSLNVNVSVEINYLKLQLLKKDTDKLSSQHHMGSLFPVSLLILCNLLNFLILITEK